MRRSIVEHNPWVVLNLYNMFEAVKKRNTHALDMALEPYFDAGLLGSNVAPTVHTDLLPYGVKRSRHVLETIARSVVDDGLAQRQVGLEEMFAPNTLDL